MAGMKVLGFTLLKSDAEKDIRGLFEEYLTQLNEQRTKHLDDITEWSTATMQFIHKHANNQKYLVEQEHQAQVENLQRFSKEFLEELHVHEERHDSQRIDQLVRQCQALKFELSKLEDYAQAIPLKGVPNKRNFSGIDQYTDDSSENTKPVFDDASTSSNDQEFNNSYKHSSSSSNRSQKYTKQMSLQYPLNNNVNSGYSGTNNQSNRQNLPAKKNDPTGKCHICFMIYPATMKPSDRKQHVEEHVYD